MAMDADEPSGPAAAGEANAPAAAEPTTAVAAGGEAEPAAGRPCYGRVKSYNHAKGIGFLECPSVGAEFGRDVFLRKDAVREEVLLSRIASGSGPKAVVQRGDILVRFALEVNASGHPEARDVVEVRRAQVPAEFLEGLATGPPPRGAAAERASRPGGGEAREARDEPLAAEARRRSAKGDGGGAGKEESEGALVVGSHSCKVGKNAKDNWDLLRAAKSKHWFFHLTDHPSAYVILECEGEPTEEERRRCAEICRDSSKKKLSGAVKVDVTTCGNVKFGRKDDEVGECNYKKDRLVEIITLT